MPSQPSRRSSIAVCIGGIPGVGKTTLLQRHVTTMEPRDRAVTGSSVLKGVIEPATFRDFDRWPEARRVAAREEAIRLLDRERRATRGRLLIDGHYTLRNRSTGRVTSIFTRSDRAFYQLLVLVEGPVEEILSWRKKDPKDRGLEDSEEVEHHLRAEREEARRLAATMGAPYIEVQAEDQVRGVRILADFLNRHAPIGVTA